MRREEEKVGEKDKPSDWEEQGAKGNTHEEFEEAYNRGNHIGVQDYIIKKKILGTWVEGAQTRGRENCCSTLPYWKQRDGDSIPKQPWALWNQPQCSCNAGGRGGKKSARGSFSKTMSNIRPRPMSRNMVGK